MITINTKRVGAGLPAYIIAEIGTNHNGKVGVAMRMVEEIQRAGADAVKIQLTDAESDYAHDSTSYQVFKQVELTLDEWKKVSDFARQCGITMFASFAHPRMIEVSRALGFSAIKISSGNLTNYPLLNAVAQSGLPIVLSTGMSYLEEVRDSVRYMERHGAREIVILQCTSLYPLLPAHVNLHAIATLAAAFPEYQIGFSDHTEGSVCALAAVALGACVVEKHVTLDQDMAGPEHRFSLTIPDLQKLIVGIREVEAALGCAEKKPVVEEMDGRHQFRRKLIAAVPIRQGEVVGEQHIAVQRSPQDGMGAEQYESVLGRTAARDISQGATLTPDMV